MASRKSRIVQFFVLSSICLMPYSYCADENQNTLNEITNSRYGQGSVLPVRQNSFLDQPRNGGGNVLNNFLDEPRNGINSVRGGSGWMDTARNFVSSPTGQMAVTMAKEFINRSAGGNQVLSLNVSNLFILVLLKALIFAAGMVGAGNWSQYGRGRSISDNSILNNSEMQLFLGFLAAEGSSQDSCLFRAACNAPEQATEYLRAATAFLQGVEIFDSSLPTNKRYNELLVNVKQAIVEGMENAPCDMMYACTA